MQPGALSQPAVVAATPWSLRIAASALSRYTLSEARWHYTDGLLFKGIFQLWHLTGDDRYWQNLVAYVDRFVDASGGIRSYTLEEYNIDQINPGKLLFPLYRVTGEERYRRAIWLLREQLRSHPRTHEGGFWHKKIYPYQMWLDGIYMGAPFYAEFAAAFDEPAAFDDLAFQIIALEKHTREPHTGLLYHAWDESRQMPWANPATGCSPHFWGRAIGWYVMAINDVLDFFPPQHPVRSELIAILERALSAVARLQDKATGLWWQVLDQGDRPGNYLEASGTSMFIYAIARGVRNGYLDSGWLPVAVRGFNGLLNHLVTLDDEGRIDLHGICSTAGLGGNPYRDGSFEYYVGEPVITNNLHGVGAFLNAAIELESALTSNTGV
ncbi:MAG: glycoside hydrolase family 88 protein [Chloroflexi bacterium]|nr:glycoside hydrolase family 88 protein [Chloroflexota bacterium]MCI0577764.1 glycoside hydrolase family 88 protein [Chloroflexota bacterium]MCI0643430.1 glycoside hydrolase family 88 protein [Chloroflexota bacterium]MCI0725911.1 glycoside hydrolase family 88 protein [Chloroflexota bacterium]